ncbi:MAG: DUF4349 domain-containing protein [Lachnospiraceae bacterium]|nr:DUF4349 domain-containing protein [Lachnospiraceae bacterium]MDD3615562.1 DUF4349 domain-containing protein [Lachnospiraceae bacterium]
MKRKKGCISKRWMRTGSIVLLVSLIMGSVAGCGAKGESTSSMAASTQMAVADTADSVPADYAQEAMSEYGVEESVEYDSNAVDDSGTGGDITSESASVEVGQGEDRKLIKTESLEVETKEFDTFIDTMTKKVEELGGYIEHSDISGNSAAYNVNRYAYYTIRIPADKLAAFVTVVEENGSVTSKSENVDDVTLNYVDTESRIKSLKKEQETLMSMLEKAETIDDIIAIQSRLTDVRYQLESYESQLRTYDNQIDYSTVNMGVNEVERESKTEDRSFGSRLKEKLSSNLYGIKTGAVEFTLWFLSSLPSILIFLAVAVILILIIKKIIKTIIKKKNQKAENPYHSTLESKPDSKTNVDTKTQPASDTNTDNNEDTELKEDTKQM